LNKSESKSFLLLQLLALLALIYGSCFYRLADNSVSHFDEYITIRAIQGIEETGNWLLPTVKGEPYLKKPPLKMWLSLIPIRLLGQSNFSFRLIDALAGAGTVLLVFFFSRCLFNLWGVGLLSSVALLGSKTYILEHGVRNAVHDSLLTFLCTAAIFCGWKYLQTISGHENHKKGRPLLYLSALLIALSILTKNVAGLFPILILTSFAICNKKLWPRLKADRSALLIALAIACSLPALYLSYHLAFSENAFSIIFRHEVVRRFEEGFHNSNNALYYLLSITKHNLYVPPLLLALGLCFSFYQSFIKRHSSHLFVIFWFLLPLILLSILPSRLHWYLAPAIPAMAIIVGALTAAFFQKLDQCSPSFANSRGSRTLLLLFGILATGSTLLLSKNYLDIITKISNESLSLPADRFVSELLNNKEDHTKVIVDKVVQSNTDQLYFSMLGNRLIRANSPGILDSLLESNPNAIVVTEIANALSLLEKQDAFSYGFLQAEPDRPKHLAVVSFKESINSFPLKPIKQNFYFAKDDVRKLIGFTTKRTLKQRLVQDTIGQLVAFTIPGDSFLRTFGAELSISSTLALDTSNTAIEISVNNQLLGSFKPLQNEFHSNKFLLQPNIILPGENIVSLRASNSEQKAEDRFLTLDRVSLELTNNSKTE
jgi:4-amino-4-deoxy-L-arabinose transferase-like glycosyltransferase